MIFFGNKIHITFCRIGIYILWSVEIIKLNIVSTINGFIIINLGASSWNPIKSLRTMVGRQHCGRRRKHKNREAKSNNWEIYNSIERFDVVTCDFGAARTQWAPDQYIKRWRKLTLFSGCHIWIFTSPAMASANPPFVETSAHRASTIFIAETFNTNRWWQVGVNVSHIPCARMRCFER